MSSHDGHPPPSEGLADEDLRRLYARATTPVLSSGASHPDEVAWERLLCGDAIGGDERRLLLEHVVGCQECTDIYRRLTMIRREAAAFDLGAPGIDRYSRLRRYGTSVSWQVYAAAAALVVAIVTPLAWRAMRQDPGASSPNSPAGTPAGASATGTTSLRDHPAFRLDKPPVLLSAGLGLTPRGTAADHQRFLEALGAALVPYRADDLPDAARRLEALSRAHPDAVEPALYGGISLLLTDRPAEAIPLLERARTLATGEHEVEAGWRLALAYVHAGAPGKARPLLDQLCAAGHAYRARACEALTTLPPAR